MFLEEMRVKFFKPCTWQCLGGEGGRDDDTQIQNSKEKPPNCKLRGILWGILSQAFGWSGWKRGRKCSKFDPLPAEPAESLDVDSRMLWFSLEGQFCCCSISPPVHFERCTQHMLSIRTCPLLPVVLSTDSESYQVALLPLLLWEGG